MDIKKFNILFIKHFEPTNDDQPKKPVYWNLSNGLCWYWSYVFVKVYGGNFVNLANQHMMVFNDGKYYDSETPEGLSELPKTWKWETITWTRQYKTMKQVKEELYMSERITNIYDRVAENIKKEL